jgi:putative endopeptidase
MRKSLIAVLPLAVSSAIWCGSLLAADPAAPVAGATSGIDFQYIDNSVRLQDDFFRHVSGKWLDTVEIPPDRARFGAFDALRDLSEKRLHEVIESLAKGEAANDPDAKKIADLYASFMDEARADRQGLKPLAGELARIDALADKRDIPALAAHLTMLNVTTPFRTLINQDARDSTRYAVYLNQSGIGLPDRDYYLKDDDAKLKGIRAEYVKHVQRTLAMAGVNDAENGAQAILQLETAIAKAQWTRVENRDPVKTYNKVEIAKLPDMLAHYDWKMYFAAGEFGDKMNYVVVRQPGFIQGLGKILDDTPLPVWKTYFKWHLLDAYAPYLDKRFVDEEFAFSGVTVRGVPENRPRWKRGVTLAEESIGEGLGRLYVGKYFPPEYKARMQALVQNLLTAYRQSIETLPWMDPATKKEALAKLAAFSPKIAYPDRWRDYTALQISGDDLVGNVARARRFEYNRQLAKLGKPVDRGEWGMTPQTVNAYYNPLKNEIVFPAAILQPPFFNPAADDAVNYGGIVAVIGHEVSHGFDDQGSQFDGEGNLRNWWTQADHDKFSKLTKALAAQYSAYSPLPGYHLNGELTLGENIGDNSGLAIAYKAYHLSLAGRTAPVIDGFSGDQRFYLGWAQVWRGKARDAETIRLIKVDPHSPSEFRCNGTLVNQPGFYSAFDIKDSDKMFVPPGQRVIIW